MTGHAILDAFIFLVICGVILWLCIWFIDFVGVPEPFRKVLRVLLGLFALVVCIDVLWSLTGHTHFLW